MSRCRVGSVGALNLKLSFGGPAGVRLIVSWWQPKWQCPSDLLSRILAVPAKVALNIDQSFLYTHLVCFSRHSVLDIVIARILYLIAHARVLLMIERGCYDFFSYSFSPESARGPGHLATRPGPLPASAHVQS